MGGDRFIRRMPPLLFFVGLFGCLVGWLVLVFWFFGLLLLLLFWFGLVWFGLVWFGLVFNTKSFSSLSSISTLLLSKQMLAYK